MADTVEQSKKVQPKITVQSKSEVIEERTGRVVNQFQSGPEAAEGVTIPPPAPGTSINFDMYCMVKNVLPQNRAGMRAFTKVRSASFEEWEEIFRSY